MQRDEYWQAVAARDKQFDGKFVFAVNSTGIYCRPSCPSRRPQRERVRFFALPSEAEQAGFRACKRCHPDRAVRDEPHLAMIDQICQYLAQASDHTVTLDELGKHFNLSPFHLQRTFKRLVGVTPRQFADARRLERFKQHLKKSEPVTDAIYESGYQSSSRAYEGAVAQLGMTPTSYRDGGTRHSIRYSIIPSSLGWLLIGTTEKGVCAVRLGDSDEELENMLRIEFPTAKLKRDEAGLGPWVNLLCSYLNGVDSHLDLPLDIRATAFQRRVYQALQCIPYGTTRSYQEVANAIGRPRAARAVARACATNPVALVIPCHRVVRGDGGLGGYRWGVDRKRKLLEQEANE
jgi:AraC family transcriptional regulator, regulatory protein of adaptative response / methylated-DNA-[protein]-cysteine methyltransferase